MNSELNKLFGREFAIGFFLPALLFFLGTTYFLRSLGVDTPLFRINWEKPFEGTGFLLVAAWVCAVFLQAVNRELFRALEGYWPQPLRKWCSHFQLKRFRQLSRELFEAQKDATDTQKLANLSTRNARDYPSKEKLVLPTSFGNAVRAYEDYPRVIYGFESINGWSRLQALMSTEFREILNQDRARVDLWLNLSFFALVFTIEIVVLGLQRGQPGSMWLALPMLIFMRFAYMRAQSSVQQYGDQVKAAFDIYLPALATKLGYVLSSDVDQNKKFWRAFSRVMVYRKEEALKSMAKAGLKRAPGSGEALNDRR